MFQNSHNRYISIAICIGSITLGGCLDSAKSGAAAAPDGPPPPASNSAPTISGAPTTAVIVGDAWTFTPSASDADGDPLTFSIENQPVWATFDTGNGTLSGLPMLGHAGTYSNIIVAVSDGQAISALPTFTLTVEDLSTESNRPPQLSGTAPTTVMIGTEYSFRPTATDPDGDALTFSIANRPSWAFYNSNTGRLSGTPDAGDVGTSRNIVISASDGEASTAMPPITIEVMAPVPSNRAPSISGTAPTRATVGQPYNFQPTASDPDGDDLQFSIANRPAWASFSASTGALSGTPGQGDVGTFGNITITVSDGELSAALSGISITVSDDNTNEAPEIAGNPPTAATVGQQYLFVPSATDPDGDTLTFSIVNRPTWASFNTSSGRLRGTPDEGDVGIHGDIQISVSDGEFTDSLPAFAITVEDVPNDPPQISGTPSTSATVGQVYSFQPSATDSNGDALTFVISGSPSWASFNTSTGRLDGTPQSSDVGVYSDILISVSDGEEADALPAFSITVTEAATGSVTLTWTPPTKNTDNSTLDDLIAYKFYYGLSPGNYPNEIRVDSPGISSYVIDNLAPDTYYIVSTAIKEGEAESVYSNEATATVVSN
jgi:hypothetical protein